MNTQAPFLNFSVTSELHISPSSIPFPLTIRKKRFIRSNPIHSSNSRKGYLTPQSLSNYSNNSATTTCSSIDERRDTLDMRSLLMQMNQTLHQTSFAANGYRVIHKMRDTLQGQLYKAQSLSTEQYVVIKKTDKSLSNQQVAVQDDMNFCVSENIIKEGLIQKYLSADNSSIGDHIIKYIDCFEDDTAHYLVMEYIESEMNLKQFVAVAHQHIAGRKLHLKRYQKVIKYLLWQLIVTIQWMHDDMRCCHLDLCMENIMLKNCDFIEHKDGGYVTVNPSISIKLGDFGVAEVFENAHMKDGFVCDKTDLSVDCAYLAPNVYAEQPYDARSADTWAFGMIMFESLTDEPLYDPMEVLSSEHSEFETLSSGYGALRNGNLKQYLLNYKRGKRLNANSMELLLNLLCIDEGKRFQAVKVLKHAWFNMYFKRYHKQIQRKTITQKQRLLKQRKTMNVPFYNPCT
eukprot:359103_1